MDLPAFVEPPLDAQVEHLRALGCQRRRGIRGRRLGDRRRLALNGHAAAQPRIGRQLPFPEQPLVAARQSYIDWLLQKIDSESSGTFGFTDVQARATWRIGERQTLRMTFIGLRRSLNPSSRASFHPLVRSRRITDIPSRYFHSSTSDRRPTRWTSAPATRCRQT
jgi:hypothetical protein